MLSRTFGLKVTYKEMVSAFGAIHNYLPVKHVLESECFESCPTLHNISPKQQQRTLNREEQYIFLRFLIFSLLYLNLIVFLYSVSDKSVTFFFGDYSQTEVFWLGMRPLLVVGVSLKVSINFSY